VKDMTADQSYADVDESNMFLTAVGGSAHGRVQGFGSMLQDKVPTATTRARQKHTASSVSGLTNNEGQRVETREELEMLLNDRDRRFDEERAAREKKMATYDLYFSKLFTMYGVQMTASQVLRQIW